MKKFITIALTLTLALTLLAGCGAKPAAPADGADAAKPAGELTTITVGASITPHAEILAVAKDILAEQGYDLVVKEFTDYVLPNTALESGDLDANYFQHKPYLDQFNTDNGTHLVSVAAIHYEPFGIYAGKSASVAEVPEGGSIAVPNDGTNEARALLLLESQGLIKLKDGAGLNATKLDIAENPKKLDIVETEAASLISALPDVDLAVINGNYALQGGKNASTDALVLEAADSEAAQTYANIIAVKEGNEKNEAILALVAALESEAVRTYITDTYAGAVVPIF
ncbi:MAG: MetQ/NlpA family ABC transporter substrate-binding protein [Oscillospiraceae bacterium]